MSEDQFHVPDQDPEYVYRWCNTDDRAMLRHKANGYEPVLDEAPELPTVKAGETPPTGSVTRRRGPDLVLCRVKRSVFEQNVESRRKALRAQHSGSIEGAVDQVNDSVAGQMRRLGLKPRQLVFKTSDQPFDQNNPRE